MNFNSTIVTSALKTRANAFDFFNPELEQAKASDGYRMKFGKQTRRS